MRFLHIVTGLLGLISGIIALYALKGGKVHRRTGLIFVFTMLLMSATGAVLAIFKPDDLGTMIAGVLTFYLVLTGLLTVRRSTQKFNWLDSGIMLIAALVCLSSLNFAYQAWMSPDGLKEGQPFVPYLIFAVVSLLAIFGDVQMMRRGIRGTHRLARHLWRMCFALWIAVTSLFLGQPQVFPKSIRHDALLAVPVLLTFLVMLYWLIRILFKKKHLIGQNNSRSDQSRGN